MSRTMTRSEELAVILSKKIEYRRAGIKDISVRKLTTLAFSKKSVPN